MCVRIVIQQTVSIINEAVSLDSRKTDGIQDMKINFRIVCLIAVLAGLSITQARAASLRDRVLNDLKIGETEQQVIVEVGFNFPVRYITHYPLDYGTELNIQVEPILVGLEEVVGLKKRETLSAPERNPAGLVRIEYEGRDLIKPTIRVVLNTARNYEVRQGDDFRSLQIVLPMAKDGGSEYTQKERVGKPSPRGLSLKRQQELIDQGADAMEQEEYMRAVLVYTALLDSTDPEIRKLARFQLATAQEHKGYLAHARAEYKNYLNDYPEGENAEDARARLKVLMSEGPAWLETTGVIPEHDYFGSFSVYYERDESLYDDQEDIENLNSLMTGFDATWRSRGENLISEVVAIGSYEHSFIDSRDDRTRVNRLYLDLGNTAETFSGRVGRQSSSKGGVLTRFDGGQVGYRFMEKVQVNLVAGFPVNLPYDGVETDKYFYGINFDLGRFWNHWDFNTYFINQISDDIDDRQAVGGEARFIMPSISFYSLLDYDILYDKVSVFLLNGNYVLPNNSTSIQLLADFRGVPILSTTNALIGQVSPSLEALEDAIGESELRRLAEDRTLDSKFASVGISQVLTDNLQIAGDISWSKIDGAPASGGVEAFESTGDEFFYFIQLIGSGLIKKGDISSVGFRYSDTNYRDTYTFTTNTRYPTFDKFWFNPRIRVDYRENKLQTGEQWRFIPGLRMEYILAENWRLEFDGEYRFADKELEGVADGKNGYYFTTGLRWDF